MSLDGRPIYQKPEKLTPEEIREGKERMQIVKQMACIICGAPPPSDAHHPIHDRYGTRKRDNRTVMPLCKAHHQHGPDAIHNGKETWRAKYGADHEYIDLVTELIEASIDF